MVAVLQQMLKHFRHNEKFGTSFLQPFEFLSKNFCENEATTQTLAVKMAHVIGFLKKSYFAIFVM